MKLNKLFTQYVNRKEKERTKGRYYSSELTGIIKGYLTPQKWLNPDPIDLLGAKRILTGVAFEEMLTKVFEETGVDFKPQVKKEIKIEDITLVAKLDFLFPTWILETKYNFGGRIENYYPQCEAYHRIFQLPVKIGIFSAPFNIKYIDYEPSDKRWQIIQNTLINFHNRICQIKKK